ncbi:glycine betaine ABC transporter substrate-binding protein, partial [Shigella flexneri]|uniref:glycine betaine ABC transporter substrate-binding protein n=1 Tax=Shigella flexneri TaxID=623 RepID=UPI0025B03B0A
MAFIAFQAQAVNVTVAYQTSAEPAKVAQADNTFAKESGASVDWRKFDSGASIVRALASGDVQIGNLGLKWHTEFGHLNRGDMLTSEQHR